MIPWSLAKIVDLRSLFIRDILTKGWKAETLLISIIYDDGNAICAVYEFPFVCTQLNPRRSPGSQEVWRKGDLGRTEVRGDHFLLQVEYARGSGLFSFYINEASVDVPSLQGATSMT